MERPLNNFKVRHEYQMKMGDYHRHGRKRYSKLEVSKSRFFDHFKKCSAHVLICSNDDPSHVRNFLKTVYLKISGIEKISVVYTASNDDFCLEYQNIADDFSDVIFIDAKNDFKSSVLCCIDTSGSHIVLAHDKCAIEEDVDITEAIVTMEATGAYAFFFNTDHKERISPCVRVGNLACAWQFDCGEEHWRKPYNLDVTLYRKRDIADTIRGLVFSSQQELKDEMLLFDNPYEIGCFFK